MRTRRNVPKSCTQTTGSETARRNAAILLESLSGACGPLEAARAMGVALARYYQLEARALQGVVEALEPLPRGRRLSDAASSAKSAAERTRLERELHRYQALYRSTQKTLGISPTKPPASEEKGGRKKRRVRKVTRGERLANGLRVILPVSPQATSSVAEGSA